MYLLAYRSDPLTPFLIGCVFTVTLAIHRSLPSVLSPDPRGFPALSKHQEENLDLLREGCSNLVVHIANARKYGVKVCCVRGRSIIKENAESSIL